MDLKTDTPTDTLPRLEIAPETEVEPIDEESGLDTVTHSEKDLAFLLDNDNWRELSFGGPGGGPCKLQAFSPRRQAAAQSIGMEFLNFDQEAVEELQATNTYDGIFMDSIIAIFLCTRPKSVAQKALRARSAIQDEVMAWMDRNRITIGSPRHGEVLDAFSEIVNAIISAAAEVDSTGLSSGESVGES